MHMALHYVSISNNDEMMKLDDILSKEGYCIVEVFVDRETSI